MLANQNVVGIDQLINRRAFAAVDFRPLEADPIVVVSFHQCAPFPDPDCSGFECSNQGRPVVHFGGFARLAIDGFVSRNKSFHRTTDALDRTHEILSEVDAVDRHIVQITSSCQFFVLTPAPAGFGEIEKPLTAEMARLAQSSALDQMAEITH